METELESYEKFVGSILRPTNFKDLKEPLHYKSLTIEVYRPQLTETIVLDDIYPFYTVYDICTYIYSKMEEKEEFHPSYQSLLIPMSSGKYKNFMCIFNPNKANLESPFTRTAGQPDPEFVDVAGSSLIKDTKSYLNITLETLIQKSEARLKREAEGEEVLETFTLHLFLYGDVFGRYPGVKPISPTDWKGKFFPYFPELDQMNPLGSYDATSSSLRVQRFVEKQRVVSAMNEIVEGWPPALDRRPGETGRGNLIALRNLRFNWASANAPPIYKKLRLESLFYDMPVSDQVPYIRFLSKSGTPISKIHVTGPLNIPTLERPEILEKWAQERSVLPEQDIILAKVLIRSGSGSVPPLYGTLHIYQDGTARFLIQPNIGTKSLSPATDLERLPQIIHNLITTVPKFMPVLGKEAPPKPLFTQNKMSLSDAYIILTLWLPKEDTEPITEKSLYRVLPYFAPFFQVTQSPIAEQNPLIFLRYKCVDNFQTQARDFQFLARIMDLQKFNGKGTVAANLVDFYKKEFDVADEVASRRVKNFIENMDKYTLTDPETLDFVSDINPGIDIAVFGHHPYYKFHIYRVDSLLTLRRIKTLLSLLVSTTKDDYSGLIKSAKVLGDADEEEQEEAEVEAEAEQEEEEQKEEQIQEEQQEEEQAEDFGEILVDDGLGDTLGLEELVEEDAPELPSGAIGGGGSQAAAAPPAKQPAPAQTQKVIKKKEEIKQDLSQLAILPAKTYFLKRLQIYDKQLFIFEAKPGSKQKTYAGMCQANALKQPTVLSEDEYELMKERYQEAEEEGKVLWIEYPLRTKSVPKPTKDDTEVIRVLRYGSNLDPGQANIFICSEYWCRYDNIVILKADFEKTQRCPFCKGSKVSNLDTIIKGETVIHRLYDLKDQKHTFVGFLGKTPHPQGLYLPCCYLRPDIYKKEPKWGPEIGIGHPAFESLKEKALGAVPGEPGVYKSAAEKIAELKGLQVKKDFKTSKIIKVDYQSKLKDITDSYIQGAEKLLELTKLGPQIGIVQPAVDTFFSQKSIPDLVKQDHTVWKLMTDNTSGVVNATGFFRIAAENSKANQPESFLAAIAPYYGENSADGMRKRILEVINNMSNLFISLNYGNFMFNFYEPNDKIISPIELKKFSLAHLNLQNGIGYHQEAVKRIYKSYNSFIEFMLDQTQEKTYKQFAHLLSLEGVLFWETSPQPSSNGILFIVLEMKADKSLEVRCPPYGVSPEAAERCDIAFIINYEGGGWEPILFTENKPGRDSDTYIIFKRDKIDAWPQIARDRLDEFKAMCHSSGLGVYSDYKLKDPSVLIPLSKALELDGGESVTILRDMYNHVSAVLFKVSERFVIVPVIDDGTIAHTANVEFDWRNFSSRLATQEIIESFYTDTLGPLLDTLDPKVKNFYQIVASKSIDKDTIKTFLTKPLPDAEAAKRQAEKIKLLQLQGGIHIPVQKSEGDSDDDDEVEQLTWMIDSTLAYGPKTADVVLKVDYKEFEEIYQHLRYTFSNWFTFKAEAAFKTEIEKILFKDGHANLTIPLYEKRQRLFIMLEPFIKRWLNTDPNPSTPNPTIKRVDCSLIRGKDDCNNRCVWKEESQTCFLHSPDTFTVGVNEVPAVELLIKKVIEELIRFPYKRDELLKRNDKYVSEYVKLRQAFRSGNEYIVPENLPAWGELLRMEWTRKISKKYIEELTSIKPQPYAGPGSASAPAPPSLEEAPFPEILKTYFGEAYMKSKGAGLTFIHFSSIVESLKSFGVSFEGKDQVEESPIVDEDNIKYAVKKAKLSLIQLLYQPDSQVAEEPIVMKLLLTESIVADYMFVVQLPSGECGIISPSPDPQPISIKTLPSKIVAILKTAPKVHY